MSKLMITVSAVLLTASYSFAQTVDKVYLQSGQILEGYISEQIPGKEITVTTESGARTCNWSDIVRTEKVFDEKAPASITETVTLKSGESITGRILVQNIGKDMTVGMQDGKRRTIPIDSVAVISSEVASAGESVWDKAPLLDRIILKDSTAVEGFIISRQMGESVSILKQNRFKPQTYPLNAIACYQKFKNGNFEPEIVSDVKVTVEGKDVAFLNTSIMFDEVRIAAEDMPQTFSENPMTIEVYGLDIKSPVNVYKVKDEYLEDEVNMAYVFNMSDKPATEAAVVDRTGNKTVLTLEVKKSGYYFVALNDFKAGIIIELYK